MECGRLQVKHGARPVDLSILPERKFYRCYGDDEACAREFRGVISLAEFGQFGC